MAKVFFMDLIRCLFAAVVVYVLSVFGFMIVQLIMNNFLEITIDSIMSYYIIVAIVSGIISVLLLGFLMPALSLTDCWDWFYSDDDCYSDPHALSVIFLLLLFTIGIGGTSAIMGLIGQEQLWTAVCKSDDWLFLVVLFPSLTVSQAVLLICMLIYYCLKICWKCGHIFCVSESVISREEWETLNGYDVEISSDKVKVRENRTHYTSNVVLCECSNCGRKFKKSQLFKYKK